MTALRRAGSRRRPCWRPSRGRSRRCASRPLAGTTFRLTYGTESGGRPAVGFDRVEARPGCCSSCAAAAGADRAARLDRHRRRCRRQGVSTSAQPSGAPARLRASIVVGADGPHSIVARSVGVDRPVRLRPRLGLSYHLADPDPTRADADAGAGPEAAPTRTHRGTRGCGCSATATSGSPPCPAAGSTSGSCSVRSWRPALVADGAPVVAARIVAAIPPAPDDPADWRTGEPLDHVAGAWPLGHRVTRRAGPRWLLVGDAAGFLDPVHG